VDGKDIWTYGSCGCDDFGLSIDGHIRLKMKIFKDRDAFYDCDTCRGCDNCAEYYFYAYVENGWRKVCNTRRFGIDFDGVNFEYESIQKYMEGNYFVEVFIGMDLCYADGHMENEWTPRLRFRA